MKRYRINPHGELDIASVDESGDGLYVLFTEAESELARLRSELEAANKRAEAAEARCKVLEAEVNAWRAAWDGREGAGDEPRYADPAHAHLESGKWDGSGEWCDSCERFAYAEECRAATDKYIALSLADDAKEGA